MGDFCQRWFSESSVICQVCCSP